MTKDDKLHYFEVLSRGIEETWRKGVFSDITVCVDTETFPCHKLVLGAMSDYFNIMFSTGFKESTEKSITLQGVDADTFQFVLTYLYTGDDVVNTTNVQQLLMASVMLQISSLQQICVSFLANHMKTDNCLGIWTISNAYNLTNLEAKAWQFIMKHFPYIKENDEFLALEFDDLVKIISSQTLNTPSEEQVCTAVLKWVIENESERMTFLPELFRNLRLCIMSENFLQDLAINPCVRDNQDCLDEVLGILSTYRDGVKDDILSYRQEIVMCMVGTRSRNPNPQKTEILCYSMRHDKSFTLPDIPVDPGPCFSVCSDGQDVFISGGYVEKRVFLHFRANKNCWEIGYMNEGRWSHGMVPIGSYVYLIGGMSVTNETMSSIDKYDTLGKKCVKVSELEEAVSSATVAAIGNIIFVFGGKLSNRQPGTLIQRIDTASGKVTIIANLPENCAGSIGRAVVLKNQIFLFLREGQIVEFEEMSPTEGRCSIVDTISKFDHFGAFENDGFVTIFGSKEREFYCYIFDPVARKTNPTIVPFKAAMCNFHCLKLSLSKKFLL